MAHQDWTCPNADADGFVFYELLKEQTIHLPYEQFLREYPMPALLVVYRERDMGQEALDPTDSGVQLLTVSIRSTAILRYLGKVAFVTKRPGNPFAHLISVGRSAKNDITIAVDSVSKVHGYFVPGDREGWSFTDHSSTNGSLLDDVELESGKKYSLEDGALLQLGLEVMLEVLSPEALYRKIHKS